MRQSERKFLTTTPMSGLRSFLNPGCILIPGFLENPGVCGINSAFLPKLVKAGLLLTTKSPKDCTFKLSFWHSSLLKEIHPS